MLLQLHDGPMSQPAPGIILPDALLVDKRDILQSAIDEVLPIIQKNIQSYKDSQNENMGSFVVILAQAAAWLAANWKDVVSFFNQFAKTIDLVKFNQAQRERYARNEYQVQQLNNMSAAEIKAQLEQIGFDMTAAAANEEPEVVAELSRFYQVYKMRLAQLPKFDWAKIGLIAAGLWAAKKIFA